VIELSPELSRPGLYWRPGLVRLYLVVVCVWLSGFGYAAYDANRQFNRAQEFLHASDTERRMGHPITYDQADVATWLTDQTERRLLALWALPLFPIGAPVLYLVGMWILLIWCPAGVTKTLRKRIGAKRPQRENSKPSRQWRHGGNHESRRDASEICRNIGPIVDCRQAEAACAHDRHFHGGLHRLDRARGVREWA